MQMNAVLFLNAACIGMFQNERLCPSVTHDSHLSLAAFSDFSLDLILFLDWRTALLYFIR